MSLMFFCSFFNSFALSEELGLVDAISSADVNVKRRKDVRH